MSVLQLLMPVISRSKGAVDLDMNTLNCGRCIKIDLIVWKGLLHPDCLHSKVDICHVLVSDIRGNKGWDS